MSDARLRNNRCDSGLFAMLSIATLMMLLGPVSASADRPDIVRKAPYLLYTGDNTAMDIHWQLYSTAVCTLAWGTEGTFPISGAVSTEYGDDHQHVVTVRSLDPATFYRYIVRAGGRLYEGTFQTAPPEDATRVKFLAYGDTRTYPADHDSVAQAMVDLCGSDPDYQTIVLNAGDYVTDGELETYWDNEFFDPAYTGIQTLLGTVAFQGCIGNHEGSGILFEKYFPYPFVDGRYWSFDYGPAHFVVVDQYTDYGPGSAQLGWIESDLAGTAKPWKFIYLHEPGWSSGGHGNDVEVQEYIQPLCEQYEVAIVFGGHNHYYARASVGGTEHITTGGGGAPLYAPSTGYPFIVATAAVHHFCRISIDGSELSFEAVTPTGEVVDSFSQFLPLGIDGTDSGGLHLEQNRPNPFCPTTTISFTAPQGGGNVRLAVYDVTGSQLRVLVDDVVPAGPARAEWDGRDADGRELGSGVYFLKLSDGDETAFRKITLLR